MTRMNTNASEGAPKMNTSSKEHMSQLVEYVRYFGGERSQQTIFFKRFYDSIIVYRGFSYQIPNAGLAKGDVTPHGKINS